MARSQQVQQDRFHYCPDMEITDWEFFGKQKRSSGMASAYAKCSYFKGRAKAVLQKTRRRIQDVVTTDETLRMMLERDLDGLEATLKPMNAKHVCEIDMIAQLLRLVAHLLGWAHLDGEHYRTPVYFQTKQQQEDDLKALREDRSYAPGLAEDRKRRELIRKMLASGDSPSFVASVMRMTVRAVRQLERAEHLEEERQGT